MKRLVIDRDQWAYLTKENQEESTCLYVPPSHQSTSGKMCCLGFLTKQRLGELGLTPYEIKQVMCEIGTPDNHAMYVRLLEKGLSREEASKVAKSSEEYRLYHRAIHINDAPWSDREDKEMRLKDLFKEYDIELEFR